jgi:hypothetical protein
MTPAPPPLPPPFPSDETLWAGKFRGRLAKLKATVAGGDQFELVFLDRKRLTNHALQVFELCDRRNFSPRLSVAVRRRLKRKGKEPRP